MKTNFKSIQAAFLDVMEQPSHQRGAFISEVCGDNTELRKQVETLFKAHEAKSGVLDRGLTHEHLCSVSLGDSIGPYKLREKIGEGGFGIVYIAEQKRPVTRTVALKVIKPGMDSRSVVARFAAERQALAMMDHPNVAKVLDAGSTETDLPYFVMELVRGVSITEYCDSKQLTIHQRLELFVDVCLAVQHAHQKGIIHRDLKPTNIMVTSVDNRPVVKVIDFGVAKALHRDLTDYSIYTGFGQLVGTPIYMSPEQAQLSSVDVDARSDIYSLGVLLYELLTTTTPFDKETLGTAGFMEVCRLIREVDPPKPSARLNSRSSIKSKTKRQTLAPRKLSRIISGELDWIVMRALEKDRSRRYQSAAGFADDVKNFLNNEIVIARPPSQGYRLKKFVKKHKSIVASFAAIALILAIGFVSILFALIEANSARELADAKTGEATREKVRARTESDNAKAEARNARQAEANAIAAHERSEALLARSHYHLAIARWNSGRVVEALDFLHRVPTSHQGLEWHLASRQFRGGIATGYGHAESVHDVAVSSNGEWIVSAGDGLRVWDAISATQKERTSESENFSSVAISQDGKLVASARNDGIVQVWNAATWQPIWTKQLDSCSVTSVAFRPDDRQLAVGVAGSAGEAASIKLWEVSSGEEVATLKHSSSILHRIGYSADGARLIAGGQSITVWNAISGQLLATLESRSRTSGVDISPDGNRFVSSGFDGTITFWDADTGTEIQTIEAHDDRINRVLFSPCGAYVASASSDMAIKIWDAKDGSELRRFQGHLNEVTSIRFFDDGSCLVSGSRDGTVKVWNLTHGNEDHALRAHVGGVRSVDFSRDGTRIVSAGRSDRTIKVWDAYSGIELQSWEGHDADITCVRFSHDGSFVASGDSAKTIKIWDSNSGNEIQSFVAHDLGVTSLDFSPDGSTIVSSSLFTLGDASTNQVVEIQSASNDGLIKLWDAKTGKELRTLDGHTHDVYCTKFSPDGRQIVSGGFDGTIRIWDVASGNELKTLRGHMLPVMSVDFSPDGSRIVSGALDQRGEPGSQQSLIKVWEVSSGRNLLTLDGHAGSVTQVRFSPNGERILSSSLDNTIRIWDAESGQELRSLDGLSTPSLSIAFSPDGNRFVSADESIRIWDATPIQDSKLLRGHSGRVHSVLLNHDGSRIYSGSEDGTVRIWDTVERSELHTLRGHTGRIASLCLSPNGDRIVSGSDDTTIMIWDARLGEEIQTLKGHAGGVFKVDIASDGSKIYSTAEGGERFVWDAQTGSRLPNEPWKHVDTPRPQSCGRWFVSKQGKNVLLIDLEFKNRPYEERIRQAKTRPDPRWHREQVEQAVRNENRYAATFHLAWILKIELDQSVAVSRIHDSALFQRANTARIGKIADFLQPVVKEVLQQ